jgi:hypothetical protein
MSSLGAVFSNIRRTLSEFNQRVRLGLRNVWLTIRRVVSPGG